MKQNPDPELCSDLFRRAENLTRIIAGDQVILRRINNDIHANELQQARLRQEIEAIRRENPIISLPSPEHPNRKPRVRIGSILNPISTSVSILAGEFDKDHRIRKLSEEISDLSFDKNDLLRDQTRQVDLINQTIADRSVLRRRRFDMGCPGARSRYF